MLKKRRVETLDGCKPILVRNPVSVLNFANDIAGT